MKVICQTCKGSGDLGQFTGGRCPVCDGTGEHEEIIHNRVVYESDDKRNKLFEDMEQFVRDFRTLMVAGFEDSKDLGITIKSLESDSSFLLTRLNDNIGVDE